jgi:cytidyltransferase-like protein
MASAPTYPDKILSLPDLARRLEGRPSGTRVVHCQGDFEVLHAGHVRYLEEAQRMGDLLVVTLNPDPHQASPGQQRGLEGSLRAEAVAALGMVDYVALSPDPSPAGAIRLIRPDIFCCPGPDGQETATVLAALRDVGARLAHTRSTLAPSAPAFSNPLSAYSPEVADYLREFAARHTSAAVVDWLARARGLRVLVVGEAILDEYHYVESMGKSGKEPILATRYLRSESFAGGILAVANNVAAFAERVDMLTVLGRQNGQPDPSEPFVRANLNPRVRPLFLYQDEAPTIVKRRFVESYPLQKLFEVYHLTHMDEASPLADEICATLERILPDYDAVIVTDYGHGMIVPRAVEILCRKARFLAVNTQTNADNQGFNTISKYPRADFVSLSEKELRLEARNRVRETGALMAEAATRIGCSTLLITRGQGGNLLYGPEQGLLACPSLSNRILDRVGAGDAVLSATSLCVAQGAPLDVVGFIGNVVGAQAVATVGHRNSLELDQIAQHVGAILG